MTLDTASMMYLLLQKEQQEKEGSHDEQFLAGGVLLGEKMS